MEHACHEQESNHSQTNYAKNQSSDCHAFTRQGTIRVCDLPERDAAKDRREQTTEAAQKEDPQHETGHGKAARSRCRLGKPGLSAHEAGLNR
jgi:hypothetical protein